MVSCVLVSQLFSEPLSLERVRRTLGDIGAFLPAMMAVSALVAGMVRLVLFHFGGVNSRSLGVSFLLGAFWHLPLTLLVVSNAAEYGEADAWSVFFGFVGAGVVASLVLLPFLWRLGRPCSR
jgi:hypothetical protein